MGITVQIIGLILSLAFLVFTHELGHLIFARIFHTRVDKFYLFFNPGFSLLRMKKYDGSWHFSFFSSSVPDEWIDHPEKTEWGIGWLPLGGYCSINGMVDETTKAGDLPEEPQPYEFRSKKTWQRFFIIIGGVLVNFISALIIYSAVLFVWGEEVVQLKDAKDGLQFTQAAKQIGFKDRDKIVSIDGKVPETISEFANTLLIDDPKSVLVNREGTQVEIQVPDNFGQLVLAEGSGTFCDYYYPFVIDSVADKSPAAKAGLLQGDSLVAINNSPMNSFFEFKTVLTDNKEKEISLAYYRNDSLYQDTLLLGKDGKLGVYPYGPQNLQVEKIEYGFFESFPEGISKGFSTLGIYVKQFKLVFTKEGAQQLGGFGTIGSIFPKIWDWHRFWAMTGFLAIILAFMNILPIPALDGGYILFILVEMITRKKPSDKFIGYANAVGFTLLIALLLYANGMDIIRAFFK